MQRPTLVWFRLDLRLSDHSALLAAAARGPVLPVFLWSPEEEGAWAPGGASRWWLHHSLKALDADLRARGSRLTIRRGPALKALQGLIEDNGAEGVVWSRRYEPALAARDGKIMEAFRSGGLSVESFNSALLYEPEELKTGAGKPYQVFTPFWKACLASAEPDAPLPAPESLSEPGHWPKSLALDELGLLSRTDWAGGLDASWTPGEAGARERLAAFSDTALDGYHEGRDRMGEDGVSRLSPHLHFGELSPRQAWDAVMRRAAGRPSRGADVFLKELGWREFAHHLLHHFPATTGAPLRQEFAGFPWRSDASAFAAWTKGRTGYPVVDAGMRQLWRTGWMHNRARMICGSFLVKDLLLSWKDGASWFWDTLVDADLASNTLGWQWTAGCGADAAPYFRVFNPILQGERFDPEGAYVRCWVPELAKMPAEWIHKPWLAPHGVIEAAGAGAYPQPLVEHGAARERALAALDSIKKGRIAP